jgi:hypothetical protein
MSPAFRFAPACASTVAAALSSFAHLGALPAGWPGTSFGTDARASCCEDPWFCVDATDAMTRADMIAALTSRAVFEASALPG